MLFRKVFLLFRNEGGVLAGRESVLTGRESNLTGRESVLTDRGSIMTRRESILGESVIAISKGGLANPKQAFVIGKGVIGGRGQKVFLLCYFGK